MDEKNILTVTQLNERLKGLVESQPGLRNIYVRGELSNYKIYPSTGYHYFTLKDEQNSISAVMFAASSLKFRPESGMRVIAFGRASLYVRDGKGQLIVSSMVPDGVGDLTVQYRQLWEKLNAEGLFNKEHKKPIPRFPMRVGVVTSGSGAAVHDIIRVLRKRWPIAKILLLPVKVQGEGAGAEIAGAVRYASRYRVADVLIVGRGGGSMEDLWCFNDERVARAIYDCEIPVISAVGHEPDVTIADYAADLRAATPSNGAERCAPDAEELREFLGASEIRMTGAVTGEISRLREKLEALAGRRVLQDPKNYVEDRKTRLAHMETRLTAAMSAAVSAARRRFAESAGRLDAMSPLKVLGRGYAIARRADGGVIRSKRDVKSGDEVILRLKRDTVECVVK